MSDAPTRCCIRTIKGERCQNDASPSHGWIMVGPVRLAACGLSGHQTTLRKLPNFVRHNVYCGAVGCDRPSATGICPKHRDMYRDFGITEHMLLATEPAPMVLTPLPVPAVQPPPTPEVPDAVAPTPPAAPESDATVVCVVDYPTPEALLSAIVGPPKVEPTAPGPTLAEVQEQLTSERKRADEADAQLKAITAALDADPERSPAWDDNDEPIPLPRRVEIALMPEGIGHSRGERRAHELEVKLGNLEAMDYPGQLQTAIAEIETACVMLRRLGGTSRSVPDLLMQVLSPEDRRAILEVEAAEWRAAIARLKARRVNPPTPEKLADYAGKLAKVEAQIAALPDSQTPAAAAWSLEAGLWLLKIAGIWLAECKPGDYLLISGAGRFPAESNDPQDVLRRRGLPLLPAEALDHSPDAGNMVDG